jgi:hypothetical protein
MNFSILLLIVIPSSYAECPGGILEKLKVEKERMDSLSSHVFELQSYLTKCTEIEAAALYLIRRAKSNSFPISLAELPSEVSLEAVQGLILDRSLHPEKVAQEYGALRQNYQRELSEARSYLETATRHFFAEQVRVHGLLRHTLGELEVQLELVKTELAILESNTQSVESKRVRFVNGLILGSKDSLNPGIPENITEKLHVLLIELFLAPREDELGIIYRIRKFIDVLNSSPHRDRIRYVVAQAASEVADKTLNVFASEMGKLESYKELLLQERLSYNQCKYLSDL